MNRHRKIILPVGTLLAAVIYLLTWRFLSFHPASPAEFQAVQGTLQRAERVEKQATYMLDASQLASEYANDARGWPARTPLQWLYNRLVAAFDREAGRGYLAGKQARIAEQRGEYEAYLADLRRKESAGVLTGPEAQILQGEAYGWPPSASPAPVSLPCQPDQQAGYPLPPGPMPACGPTPTPTLYPLQIAVPHRGPYPATLPLESIALELLSVRLRGDEARAVVHRSGGISAIVLVKVAGQWYIAGARLLEKTT
jgi:hypothetical protein